jgi:hypothetical protein
MKRSVVSMKRKSGFIASPANLSFNQGITFSHALTIIHISLIQVSIVPIVLPQKIQESRTYHMNHLIILNQRFIHFSLHSS